MNSVQTTYQAYRLIREQIITLKLAPGSLINEEYLAGSLAMDLATVQEALRLLVHDDLVKVDPQYGVHVSNVYLADLKELTDLRLTLEPLSAWLAAQQATYDDIVVLNSLCQEYAQTPTDDSKQLLELDHKFHQSIAQATHNKYLAAALDHYYGLAQRLWFLTLPKLHFLSPLVEQHLALLEAIKIEDAELARSIMHNHIEEFYIKIREALTGRVTVNYGSEECSVIVENRALLGGAIIATGLPFEQPCGGQGVCGKCKVAVEGQLNPPDEVEQERLSQAELSLGYRLACRALVTGDALVKLAPIEVYSNKIFQTCDIDEHTDAPLGLAIDLGSTTVAAFLVKMPERKVCAGSAALNHQTVFGSDIISRLAEAALGGEYAERLSALAQVSITQAFDAFELSRQVRSRIHKVVIVGNCAMHHLLLRYPVTTLTVLPFQPSSTQTVRGELFHGIVPPQAEVIMPPLIGGFVGSDALACLVYFNFDRAPGPMAAIDLGTNGEVMVSDGKRILVTSTAAGPAFEGVNISCGTRAVSGAIVAVKTQPEDGSFSFTTIGNQTPVGLTGSGLLSVVHELRRVGVIHYSGRFISEHQAFGARFGKDENGMRRIMLTEEVKNKGPLYLTQADVRELQKAKAAIHASIAILLHQLGLEARDLQRVIFTGSFGSQVDVNAVLEVGMIPPVNPDIIETQVNGAGFGAALFLNEEELERGERLATLAEQIDLDQTPDFNTRFINTLHMPEISEMKT